VTSTGRWFFPVSSTNKTDRHDIAEILLNVALNTINQNQICRKFLILLINMHAYFSLQLCNITRVDPVQVQRAWCHERKKQYAIIEDE
jgi:hypothetical protein